MDGLGTNLGGAAARRFGNPGGPPWESGEVFQKEGQMLEGPGKHRRARLFLG